MNLYACLGKVIYVGKDGKQLKFTFSIWQRKTCYVPCVIFNPKDEDKEYISSLQSTNKIVWMQGWFVNYDIKIHDTRISTIELATTLFNIKEV